MDVVSLCPLRVSSLIWRPSSGGHALTVICKGTFELRPSELALAQQQEDPSEEDNFWDDDPNRSVRAPSDLVPFKARADVMLVGQAFAPNRTPVRSLLARLSVAGVEKAIEVCGERTWTPEAGLREGHPFTSMQLRYERAAGGPDNPVGVRVDPRSGGSLPNLQVPGGANGRGPDATTPIGFGPIAARWPTRRARLGGYAAAFDQHRWGDDALPEDFDPAFFNAAPLDQQPERIEPGARLLLENLDPRYGRISTKVPRQRPRAFVDRNGGLEELQLLCDTLWIDTDRGLCTLTWRGQIGVHGPRDEGRVVILLEQPTHPLTWPEIQQQCAAPPPAAERAPLPSMADESDTAVHDTSMFRGTSLEPALPFLRSKAAPKAAPRPSVTRPPPWLEAPAPVISSGPMMNETLPPGALRVDLSRLHEDESRSGPPPAVPEFMQQPPRTPLPSAPRIEMPVPPPTMGAPVFVPQPHIISSPASSAPPPLPPLSQPMPLPLPQQVPPPLAQPMPPPLPSSAASPRAATTPEILELVGYDPTTPDKVHLHLPWQELIARLQPEAKEVEYDDDPVEESTEVKDRRDIFGVLAEGEPTSLDELEAKLGAATSPSGVFEPPLLLLRGELELTFTELETLKATLAAVAPFTSGPDKKLKDAFEATSEALKSPYIQASGRALEGLTTRLRDAFPQVAASLPAGYLDQQVERILVEQRHHQKRTILGKPWVRALLGPRGAAVPTYVPEELAAKLPLYARFTAKLIVDLNLQQDQYESHPCALLCLALARVVPSRSAPRGRPTSGSRAE